MLQVLGERLKALREEKGISQDELATALEMSRLSIGNYERGVRTPEAETIIRLAKHFSVSADYLLGLSDVKSVDADIKSVCEFTGLSECAVGTLVNKENDFSHYLPVLNYLIEIENVNNKVEVPDEEPELGIISLIWDFAQSKNMPNKYYVYSKGKLVETDEKGKWSNTISLQILNHQAFAEKIVSAGCAAGEIIYLNT